MQHRAHVRKTVRRITQELIPALLLLSSLSLASAQQLPLTKAGEVHNLPPELAAQSIPVHLIATVSYYEPAESTLFVADASGAVYVSTTHPYPLHRGDLVRIDGVTAKSYRTIVASPSFQVIGTSHLTPHPIRNFQAYRELMAGKWDCQYVVMRGTVRSAQVESHSTNNTVLEMEVSMPGGIVQSYLQDFHGIDVSKLDGAEVELSGIAAGDFNAKWQLMHSVIYSSDAHDLHIVNEPKVTVASLPLTSIDDVMQTHSVSDRTERIRVRGAVTFYHGGNAVVIQQNDRSLFANTRQIEDVPLGSVVDLVGFADEGGYGPSLFQTQIFPTGQFAPIQPVPVSYAEAISGIHSDNLVSIKGRLISQMHSVSSDDLSLMVDDHAVTVGLQLPGSDERLPQMPIGAILAVTGICRITPTNVWGTTGMSPMLFQINIRSRDDIRILALPSWWTVAHLLFVVGALLVVSLLIAFWAMILRRRIAQQTGTIKRTMHLERERSRLLEAINSETPLEQLLASICDCVQSLAPRLRCSCAVSDLSIGSRGPAQPLQIGKLPSPIVFQAALTDSKGREMGTFQAGINDPDLLSKFEAEVLQVGTGLASLAVNQRRIYQELNYTSTHDQLTSLPNRRLSDMTLESALSEAAASGTRLGVAYIDVDLFKDVNDRYGHKIGDLYLQQIAQRLASQIRSTDKLARIGGDEFLLIANAVKSVEDLDAYKSRLENCFSHPFTLDGCHISGSASIGVAVFPDQGRDAEALKRNADNAMYAAKRRRRAEQALLASTQTDALSSLDMEPNCQVAPI
jgi:diguanylate cyclase (GGDEF)-like protein